MGCLCFCSQRSRALRVKDVPPYSSHATSQNKVPMGMMDTHDSQSDVSSGGDPTSPARSTSASVMPLQPNAAPSATSSTPSGVQPGDAQRLIHLQQMVRSSDQNKLIRELTPPSGSNTETSLARASDAFDLLTWRSQPPVWGPATYNGTVHYVDMATRPAGLDPAAVIPPARRTSISGIAPLLGAFSKGTFRRDQKLCSEMAALLCKQRLEVHASVELAYNVKDRQVGLRLLDMACSVKNRVFGVKGIGHTPFHVSMKAIPPPALMQELSCLRPLLDTTQHASRTAEDCEVSAFFQDPVGLQVKPSLPQAVLSFECVSLTQAGVQHAV